MHSRVASASFLSYSSAVTAVAASRGVGVPEGALSILTPRHDAAGAPDNDAADQGLLQNLLGGGALGAAIGVAVLAIPGVGPLAAAGAIAAGLAPAVAATGAAIGSFAGLLNPFGVEREVAEAYGEDVRAGGVLLLVDTTGTDVAVSDAQDVLDQNGDEVGRSTYGGKDDNAHHRDG